MKLNAVLVLITALLFSVSASAKIAVADVQKAIADTSYVKQQMSKLDRLLKSDQNRQKSLSTEMNRLRSQVQSSASLSSSERAKLEKEYATKLDMFNKNASAMQQKAQSTLSNVSRTMTPKLERVANQLRKEGNYEVILDRKSVISFNSADDLTSKITQRLNSSR